MNAGMSWALITARQQSFGKVMFSQMSVCPRRGGAEYLWSHVLSLSLVPCPFWGRVYLVPCPFQGVGIHNPPDALPPGYPISGIPYPPEPQTGSYWNAFLFFG